MNRRSKAGSGLLLRAAAALVALVAMLSAAVAPAAAQGGTATIVVNSYTEDGSTPLAFARFQVIDSNGTDYGKLETAPGAAQVSFVVNVDETTTFTISEETPPACGIAPDPVEVGPLADGEVYAVDVLTAFQSDCDLGSLAAYTFLCPDGFDTTVDDYAAWRDGCTRPVNGASFQFRRANGEQWTAVTGAYGIPGRAPLIGLVPDEYTIRQQVDSATNDGLSGPTIYCLNYPSPNPAEAPEPDDVFRPEGTDGAAVLTVDGNRVACDFFYVPGGDPPADDDDDAGNQGDDDAGNQGDDDQADDDAQAAATGSIELHKAECPAGYEPNNDIFDDCHGAGVEGVEFTIEGPGNSDDSAETVIENDPGPGIVRFTELAAGTYTITEDVTGDVEIFVYCSLAEADDLVAFSYTDDGGIELALGAGVDVICDWYNIPRESGESTLQIRKLICPPGTTENYFDICFDNRLEDISFTVQGPNSYDKTDDTNSNGLVKFTGLGPGDYDITESIPGDVNDIFVYCSFGGVRLPLDYIGTYGIELAIDATGDYFCDWYNIPTQQFDPGDVTVTKYTCEAGYDAGDATYQDFLDDCDEPTEGVTFRLTGEGEIEPRADTTGADGRASFGNLSPNTYQLGEDVGDEFALPYAFCTVDGGDPFQADLSDGFAYFEIGDDGTEIVCDWFNVPEDLRADATVTIRKLLCPPGTTGNYFDACFDEKLADVTFGATGPNGYAASAATNANGLVVFDELVAGNYVFTEEPIAAGNPAVYVVVCAEGGAEHPFTYDDATGLRIKLKVGVGDDIHCDWYNVPPKQGPDGSITIRKFLCQGKTDNDYDWEADCESYGAGAEFELMAKGGAVLATGTTNDAGTLTFTGLDDGAYGLDETTGDWCHAEADLVDAQGNVLVRDEGNTDVFIYNCGKKVSQLPSTGVGPAAAEAGVTLWYGVIALGLLGLMVEAARRQRMARAARCV